MNRRLLIVCAALQLFIPLFGCSHKPFVHTSRNYSTRIAPNPEVTVLLSYYGECDQSGETTCLEDFVSPVWDKDMSPGREEDIASCVFKGIKLKIPGAVYIPPREGRVRFLGTEMAVPSPVGVESILSLLKAKNLIGQSPRYILLVQMTTKSVNKETALALHVDRDYWLWGVERKWRQETSCSAAVIDVADAKAVGTVTSYVSGTSSVGFPVLYVIPLPPFPLFAATENSACTALGEALGNFLAGADQPEETN